MSSVDELRTKDRGSEKCLALAEGLGTMGKGSEECLTLGLKTMARGSEECFTFECDLCKYQDVVIKANAYCIVCAEYLCQACEQAHRRSKASRDHELLTGSKLMTTVKPKPKLPIAYCEDHNTIEITMYCDNHLSLVCDICKTTRHRKCRTSSLEDKIGPMKRNSDFDKSIEECMKVKEKFEQLQTKLDKALNKIKNETSTCLKDMRELRKKMNTLFDELEENMANEIANLEEAITNEISNQLFAIGNIVKQTDESLKTLNECSNTRDEKLMFIGMKKSMDKLIQNGRLIKDIEATEITNTSTTFKPTAVIADVLLGLKTIGTLRYHLQSENKVKVRKPQLNLNTSSCRDFSVKLTYITGCTFMPNGELIMCDNTNCKLLVFDNDCKAKEEIGMYSAPWDVAVANNIEVLCSLPHIKKVQFVTIDKFVTNGKQLATSGKCYGVHVHNDTIYTTCYNGPGKSEIQLLDIEGHILKRLGMDSHGDYMFINPCYIGVNAVGDRVYVSDPSTNRVTCMSVQGEVLYQYMDTNLRLPRGMIVDGDDNVLVCGTGSKNVHVIRKDGTKHKVVFLNVEDSPSSIAYRDKDGALVFGLDTSLEQKTVAKGFTTE